MSEPQGLHEAGDADGLAPFVAHADFKAGLPRGRFRVIVNPKLARGLVKQRLWLTPILLPILGVGLALALSGFTVAGALLVFAGVALHRVVLWSSPRILLYLATQDPSVYAAATQGGVMEVRYAAS